MACIYSLLFCRKSAPVCVQYIDVRWQIRSGLDVYRHLSPPSAFVAYPVVKAPELSAGRGHQQKKTVSICQLLIFRLRFGSAYLEV